ncbi:hypothetical protein [Massilia sp. erpn]|nr:hypothetical protein [Massilia sp. erpn]
MFKAWIQHHFRDEDSARFAISVFGGLLGFAGFCLAMIGILLSR